MQNLKYLYCYYISSRHIIIHQPNHIAQIIKHYLFIFFLLQDLYLYLKKIPFLYHLFLLFFHVDTIQLFTKILISEATAARLIVVWTELVVTVLQFLMNVARRQIDLPCHIHGIRLLRTMGSKKESVSHGWFTTARMETSTNVGTNE